MGGPQKWTEEVIEERFRDGRGRGTRETYSPWIKMQEFSSRGNQTRVPGAKLNRTIHTFSYLERAMFLLTEFSDGFWDYNEQRPIERAVTLGFAKKLALKHPRYPRTGVPLVMTLDAVVTEVDADGELRTSAWDAKPARQLEKLRVREKLSLHKAYCAHIGIPHYIFTETSAPRNVVRNIDFIRMSLPKDGEVLTVPGLLTWHLDQFHEDLFKCRTRPSVTHFCAQYDSANGLERGAGLRIFKNLVWQRRIEVDLSAQWLERQPIPRRGELTPCFDLRRAA